MVVDRGTLQKTLSARLECPLQDVLASSARGTRCPDGATCSTQQPWTISHQRANENRHMEPSSSPARPLELLKAGLVELKDEVSERQLLVDALKERAELLEVTRRSSPVRLSHPPLSWCRFVF